MLETERLRIRPLQKEDAADIQDIFDHPRFYYLDAEYAGKNAKKFLEKFVDLQNEDPLEGPVLLELAIEHKDTSKVIGCFSLGNDHLLSRLSEYGTEVTGFLHPHAWGKNFPKEIMDALLPYYAKRFTVNSFYATADPSNKSSIAVMRRFGFSKAESLADPYEIKLYNGPRDVFIKTIDQA